VKPTPGRWPIALTCVLVVMWLLLNQTLALGHLLIGIVLAVLLAWATRYLRPLQPRISRPWLFVPLLFMVLADIVRSNIGVARIVLGLVGERKVRSGFVRIPLDMRDPHALAVLAGIVTSTPGTVWVGVDEGGKRLTLHVLDLRDESEWVRWIKQRYERLLMRIFE